MILLKDGLEIGFRSLKADALFQMPQQLEVRWMDISYTDNVRVCSDIEWHLSDDDRREREDTELACAREIEEFLAGADEVTLGEEKHGMQSFSATFRLDNEQSDKFNKPSWWERLYSKLKRFKNL